MKNEWKVRHAGDEYEKLFTKYIGYKIQYFLVSAYFTPLDIKRQNSWVAYIKFEVLARPQEN